MSRSLLCLAHLTLVVILASADHAFAQDRASIQRQFTNWLASEIRPAALASGISAKTLDRTLSGLKPDLDLPGLVSPGSAGETPKRQSQAEFRPPARYFSENILAPTVAAGRTRLARHRDLLARIEARTGVPGHIAIAIWGRESGYGRAAIPHDAFTVLATRAFMSPRRELFAGELLAALKMVEKRGIDPKRMKSSWAGAMGQPQFLPSSFLEHAADGNGDGVEDIWGSEADTLASIAAYLDHFGWVAGRDWGFEVDVPPSVPCYLEGPDRGSRISQWADMGITRVGGRPFPDHELNGIGFLMMPAGRHGPAFLVTPNFYVLKEYNESDAYALFIGHAGDRIAYGVRPFHAQWKPLPEMLRSEIAVMQRRMEKLGYDVGGADGLPGFKTRRSIGEWQSAQGMKPTCFPTPELKRKIR